MKKNKNEYKINMVCCTVCGRQYSGYNIMQYTDTNTTTIDVNIICKKCFKDLLGSEFDEDYGYI